MTENSIKTSFIPSEEQKNIIDVHGTGQAVLAGAGCGKTTTIVQKCLSLLSSNPKARFVAVSFTERSANDLKVKLSEKIKLQSCGTQQGHWVMTIHGLCGSILKEYPYEAGLVGDESILSELESKRLWQESFQELWLSDFSDSPQLKEDLEKILTRESHSQLFDLLTRMKKLESFGLKEFINKENLDSILYSLWRIYSVVIRKYENQKERLGVLDFDDLEVRALRALRFQHVQKEYQHRWDLVVVDEFQDTNPLQGKIIELFASPGFKNLCIVGDPKQSIYRFRDADVSVFEEFCDKLSIKQTLSGNYRSRPDIIEFVNTVCEPLFKASGMRYDPLVAKRNTSDFELGLSVQSQLKQNDSDLSLPAQSQVNQNDLDLELHSPSSLASHTKVNHENKQKINKPKNKKPIHFLKVKSPHELAQWLQNESKSVPYEDCALLLRRIRGNEKWLQALLAARIPIVIGSGGLFWDEPRVRELISFLRWWIQPLNRLSGAVFLRAPWMNEIILNDDAVVANERESEIGSDKSMNEKTIVDSVLGDKIIIDKILIDKTDKVENTNKTNTTDKTIDEWLQSEKPLEENFFNSTHPVAIALKPYWNKVIRPGELLLHLLSAHESFESLLGRDILALWHRLEEYSLQGFSFEQAVNELSRGFQSNQRESQVPPPKESGKLTVLTLHGSKGLEFPHVILLDLPSKQKRASNSPTLYWDRTDGVYLAPRSEDGQKDKKDKNLKRWNEKEKAEELNESKRLFYVAITRPKERLICVYNEDTQPASLKKESNDFSVAATASSENSSRIKSIENYDSNSYQTDFWRAWIFCSYDKWKKLASFETFIAANNLDNSYVKEGENINKKNNADNSPAEKNKIKFNNLKNNANKNLFHSKQFNLTEKEYLKFQKRKRQSVTEWKWMEDCPRAYEWTYVRPRWSFDKLHLDRNFNSLFNNSVNNTDKECKKNNSNREDATDTVNFKNIANLKLANEINSSSKRIIAQVDLGKKIHFCLEHGDQQGLRDLQNEVGKENFSAESLIHWMNHSPYMNKDYEYWNEFPFEIFYSNETIVGVMDRLVKISDSEYVIVDFKTSKSAPSEENIKKYKFQLEVYAWALNLILSEINLSYFEGKRTFENHAKSSIFKIKAVIVSIFEDQVKEINFEPNLQLTEAKINENLNKIRSVIENPNQLPTPGAHCCYCLFQARCDAFISKEY